MTALRSAPSQTPSAVAVAIRDLVHRYRGRDILRALQLEIYQGEWLSLLGESGSGKTTLVRLIAGLETPAQGSIAIQGQPQARVPTHRRPLMLVPQSAPCYEHLTAAENLALAQRLSSNSGKWTPQEGAQWYEEVITGLELHSFLERKPGQLSGGERQRLAIARAILPRRPLLLLDEPFAHLNESLREAIGQRLRAWTSKLGITTVHVTHDSIEAVQLSDRVALLCNGIIEQIDAPNLILDHPATPQAAHLLARAGRFLDRGDSVGGHRT